MYESFIHVILRHDHRLPSSLSETSTDVSPEAIATVNKMKLIVTLRKNEVLCFNHCRKHLG